MRATFALIISGVMSAFAANVSADCGHIPYPPSPNDYDPNVPVPDGLPRYGASYFEKVKISEPSQKAVIAWNGREEILVLSTDLHSTYQTRSLEVIPFPSRPAVEKGDPKLFEHAMEYIHRAYPEMTGKRLLGARAPGGEVVEVKRIGAHEIHVVHALDPDEFVKWVVDYLREKAKLDAPMIPDSLKKNVEAYIKEGYDWFVFDVVQVGKAKATKDALMYRFETDHVFYPLKISRSTSGNSKIELIVITHDKITEFLGHKRIEWKAPIDLSAGDVKRLSPKINELLDGRDVQMRYWVIEAPLEALSLDLIVR